VAQKRLFSRIALLSFSALTFLACPRERPSVKSGTLSERETHGDTLIVRSGSRGLWGDSSELIEELRLGSTDGGDNYTFSDLVDMTVAPNGSLYVCDKRIQVCRMYDSAGKFIRQIGRKGKGPGEFEMELGLALLPDGRLVLRDGRNARLNIYSPGGDFLTSWPLPSGLYASKMLFADAAGITYALTLAVPMTALKPDEPWPMGYIRYDTAGRILDTIPVPNFFGTSASPPDFGVKQHVTLHPAGSFVSGLSSDYAISWRQPSGKVLRIERPNLPRIEVPAALRSAYDSMGRAVAAARRSNPYNRGSAPQPTPSHKPAFKNVLVGADGRIWVELHGVSYETIPMTRGEQALPAFARWRERTTFDVFESDGRYLGNVPLPQGGVFHVMRGDRVWGTVRDEIGALYVVRWRVAHRQ
jgi:hypothetical protein